MTDQSSSTISRRGLLAGALAGSAAYALPLKLPAGAQARGSLGAGTAGATTPAFDFFSDSALNFQMLFALGGAGYRASDVGEVLAIFDRINSRGAGFNVVYEEYLKAGRRLRENGDDARKRGRRVSAFEFYLRSAMYLDQALFYVLATGNPTRKHEGQIYSEMERSWSRAASQARPRFTRVRIPYGKRGMPGWLLTADGAGPRSRRPTIILNNGSDAQNIDMWVYGGAAAIERGWNALIFEGPGQGAQLFLHNIPFRPDWQKVITPVVNFLRRRPEVDKKRVCLAGQSFGGYLVLEAAAYEHRLAGVVADPGVVDPFETWSKGLPPAMMELFRAGRKAEFNGFWDEALKEMSPAERFNMAKRTEIYGNGTFFDQMTLASKFVGSQQLFARIKAPTAVLSPAEEQFFPGQPEKAFSWLRAKPKSLIKFTVAEGAQFHCEPMAPQLRNERVYDWLERNMKPTG